MTSKDDVAEFWNAAACGEAQLLQAPTVQGFRVQALKRYSLEPYIISFADFDQWTDCDVLEVGLGLGADHERFAAAGAKLSGVDLTARAVEMTRRRLMLNGLESDLRVGDAEHLPFDDNSFDLVYSWGVIHHSPDTERAASEILRVLRPGGEFRVMIYHKWSLVGFMLWLRYGLLSGRLFTSLSYVYSHYLESPGTKAYTRKQGARLFANANSLSATIQLTHGDLLDSGAGQRHEGRLLSFARLIWPRWVLRRIAGRLGLFLLISGCKPQ